MPIGARVQRAPVDFAFSSGWRFRNEVLRLTCENVDLAAREGRLWPGTTKSGKGRVIALRPHELGILRAQREQHDRQHPACPVVFCNLGAPIVNPYKAWRAACAAAGVPGKLLHDLRRSAVRLLVRSGVSEKVAMERTGHKTRSGFDAMTSRRKPTAVRLRRSSRRRIEEALATLWLHQGRRQARRVL